MKMLFLMMRNPLFLFHISVNISVFYVIVLKDRFRLQFWLLFLVQHSDYLFFSKEFLCIFNMRKLFTQQHACSCVSPLEFLHGSFINLKISVTSLRDRSLLLFEWTEFGLWCLFLKVKILIQVGLQILLFKEDMTSLSIPCLILSSTALVLMLLLSCLNVNSLILGELDLSEKGLLWSTWEDGISPLHPAYMGFGGHEFYKFVSPHIEGRLAQV